MALRKKAMAIVLSMAMVATSLSLPNMTAKTAQAAGSYAVQVNTADNLWPDLTDFHATDCQQLLQAVTG